MGGCQFGLGYIRYKIAVISYGYSCKEDLVYCCEDIKQRNAIISHENGTYIEEEAESYKIDDLCQSKEKT